MDEATTLKKYDAGLADELRFALSRRQFTLEFQPVIDLASGRVTGTEALLRWNHPRLGRLQPAEFIMAAEDHGTIHSLGEWVLRSACAQLTHWMDQGVLDHRMMINVSAIQLRAEPFARCVARTLREFGIQAHLVELELTETQLMSDMQGAQVFFQSMRTLGVRTSLDDFGVGYNSLEYLRLFPFDTIKIDRLFVGDICTDARVLSIARAITSLGHDLGMTVVAEGVETDAQRILLTSLGCDEAQGFLLGAPMSEKRCTELLVQQHEPRIEVRGASDSLKNARLPKAWATALSG